MRPCCPCAAPTLTGFKALARFVLKDADSVASCVYVTVRATCSCARACNNKTYSCTPGVDLGFCLYWVAFRSEIDEDTRQMWAQAANAEELRRQARKTASWQKLPTYQGSQEL